MAVFMTPDSESGIAVFPRRGVQMLAPIPLCLDSPAVSPPPSPLGTAVGSLELVDILQCLLDRGIPNLAREILSYLSGEDLIQCLRVNCSWNELICQDSFLTDRITEYKKHRASFSNPSRPPLRMLWERPALRANAAKPLPSPAAITPLWKQWKVHSLVYPGYTPLPTIPRNIKVHSCPKCNSPAKELNLRRVSCTKCGLDYCKDCFREWHESKCRGIGGSGVEPERELKRSSSVNIAGNARSRKRLKRL